MAAPAASSPFLPVPATLPDQCRGRALYEEVKLEQLLPRGGTATSSGRPPGFSFGKALSGIKSELGAADNSRGDGRFDGGATVLQQGNVVHLAPNALTDENAERTLEMLDRIQKGVQGSSSGDPAPQPAKKAPARTKPPPPRFGSVYDAAGGLMNDVADDGPTAGPPAAAPAPPQQQQQGTQGGEGGGSRSSPWSFDHAVGEEPAHRVVELEGDADGQGPRLELHIEMPKLASAADASVDIGPRQVKVTSPGTYRLVVRLPCAVDDAAAKARWVKGRRTLVLTLPKAAA